MTPEFAAAGAVRPIGELENAWTTDARVLRRARVLELSAWNFALAGRAGVLGDDIAIEILAAALGTVAPEALRDGWTAAGRVGPAAVASARLVECACWGADRLAGVADEHLADLLGRVVAAADAAAMPVFAATRRLVAQVLADPPAAGPGARVALLAHALAELRTGAMLIACRAAGLTAVEALVAGPQGEQDAVLHGWSLPFPPRLPLLRRYMHAGAIADRMSRGAYAALTAPERVELVERLTSAAAAVACTA